MEIISLEIIIEGAINVRRPRVNVYYFRVGLKYAFQVAEIRILYFAARERASRAFPAENFLRRQM